MNIHDLRTQKHLEEAINGAETPSMNHNSARPFVAKSINSYQCFLRPGDQSNRLRKDGQAL